MTSEQETAMYDQPDPGDERTPEFEALEQELFKHQPVLSMADGSIAGCQCMDRVFYKRTEDWGTHLAEIFEPLAHRGPVQIPSGHAKDLATSAERVKNGADSSRVTPTDDELRREVERVQKAAWAEIHGQDCRRQYSVAEVKRLVYSFDNLLGSLLHRTVQAEPSRDREAQGMSEAEDYARDTEPSKRAETVDDFMTGWRTADRTRVQGEPSDAAIQAAEDAWYAPGNMSIRDAMRAALKAAAAVQGGETR